jgi:hypothetical protein
MEQQPDLFLEDQSSDRKYFTIIPNYIANHSTANDQALYFQIKKFSGDKGTCFVSQRTLMRKLGIGQKALNKSIKYLTDHKWISFAGYKNIITEGGSQKVKSYRVNDIWKLNNEHYQGVSESTPLSQGVAESNSGCSQKEVQGVAESSTNKIKIKEDKENKREIKNSPSPSEYFNSPVLQEKVIQWLESKKVPRLTALRELNKFNAYWTEISKSGMRVRWQSENFFDVRRRLHTWFSNVDKFSGKGRIEKESKFSFN